MAREVRFASSGRALRRLLRRAESSSLRAVGVDALDRRGRPPETLSCFRCLRADEARAAAPQPRFPQAAVAAAPREGRTMTEGDSLARRVPRRPTGSIESYPWKDGRTVTWRLRFRAYGKRHRVDLGTNHEGWNEDRAQVELERIMRQVERGTWEPASDAEDVGSDSD